MATPGRSGRSAVNPAPRLLFMVEQDKITEIGLVMDPARLSALDIEIASGGAAKSGGRNSTTP